MNTKEKEQNKNIKMMQSKGRRNDKTVYITIINTKKKVKISISIYRNSKRITQGITRNITNNTINLIMQKTKNEF